MALEIYRKDNQFRVEGQGIKVSWLPDTPANRKSVVVFLRLHVDDFDQPLFTYQQLAKIVESDNRQAASGHFEEFRTCDNDFGMLLTRKRKVDASVVDATLAELQIDPLAEVTVLQQRVNTRLEREDLSRANIDAALEQISSKPLRSIVKKQLARGIVAYREEYLLKEMISCVSAESSEKVSLVKEESEGMTLSDPTAIRTLFDPTAFVESVSAPMKWLSFLMALYYHGLPLSVLGKWIGVHKTTVLRWIIGMTVAIWPIVAHWLKENVKATVVYIDEKWIKIGGKWYYQWFGHFLICI